MRNLWKVICIAGMLLIFTLSRVMSPSSEAVLYKSNWNIEIPLNMKVSYSASTEERALGDGERYTVFISDTISDAFTKEFTALDAIKRKDAEDFINGVATRLHVPAEQKISKLDGCVWKQYVKKDNSRLVIVYNPGSGELHFVERLQ